MRLAFFVAVLPAVATFALAACGGAVKSSGSSEQSIDSGVVDEVDSGNACFGCSIDAGPPTPVQTPVDPNYPTTHTPIPPVTYNGGNILDTPDLVTITFDGDALRTQIEGFDDVITTTKWWTAVSAEYCDARGKCIGPGTSTQHIHVPTAPATMLDDTAADMSSGLKIYIDQQIQSGLFPVPDSNTVYMIYLPSTTKVTLDGATSCDQFGGYHNAMTSTPPGTTTPVQFAYAILPRCSNSKDELTYAASHEIIESVTDPFISGDGQSYYAFGSDSDAWDYPGGGEVGDRCVDLSGQGNDTYEESGFTVQRTWSNAAAKASHDPCVPAPAPSQQPYFNIAPPGSDVINMTVGQTLVIPLTAFSDAEMPAFTIEAMETSEYVGLSDVLNLDLDQTSVQNGQKASLTVNLQSPPTQGTALFVVTATSDATSHQWSFIVQSQ